MSDLSAKIARLFLAVTFVATSLLVSPVFNATPAARTDLPTLRADSSAAMIEPVASDAQPGRLKPSV